MRKSVHEAIGMIALAALVSTASVRAARAMPSPHPFDGVMSAPVETRASESAPGSRLTEVAGNVIRVRVSKLGASAALSGVNLRFNDGPPQNGYHAYKLIQFTEGRWLIQDRDTDVVIGTGNRVRGENLRLNLKSVPDELTLTRRNAIASLDIETYLKGVLPAEMPASWPLEALKAQAIAARTFALYRKAQTSNAEFDLDSDVSDQMFAHPLVATARVDRAVNETRGFVLRDANGTLIPTYFHADCGGQTEEARDVWGSGAKTGTTTDVGCPLNPKARWTLTVTLEQLREKLRAKNLRDLSIGSKTGSGRINEMNLAYQDGTTAALGGNALRTALGYDKLKSTAFTFARRGDTFVFKGQGYGHGVGLCQWGARQMAKAGKDFDEILKHYYSRAQLDRHPNLYNKERHGTHNEQAAQFHKSSLPRL